MQTFYGVLRCVFPIFRSLEFQSTSWTRSSPRSPRERIHSPWCFFWNLKKTSAIFLIFPKKPNNCSNQFFFFQKNSTFLQLTQEKTGLELDGRQVYVFAAMTEYHVYGAMEVWFVTAEIHHQALE